MLLEALGVVGMIVSACVVADDVGNKVGKAKEKIEEYKANPDSRPSAADVMDDVYHGVKHATYEAFSDMDSRVRNAGYGDELDRRYAERGISLDDFKDEDDEEDSY